MKIPGLSVRLDMQGLAWRATRFPGVEWYPLHHGEPIAGAGHQDAAVLIRMDPGASYPAHRHLGIEDVLILEGGYRDEFGEHGPGSYVRYPEGSVHRPIATGDPGKRASEGNPACVMFAIARGGVENLGAVPVDQPFSHPANGG